MKKSIVLIIAASTLVLAGCCTTHRAARWEYKQLAPRVTDETLNKLAEEGWSVVAVGTDNGSSFYILKRAKK
jgi:PBP1b-binding outer membrane lipoprotein LpoB